MDASIGTLGRATRQARKEALQRLADLYPAQYEEFMADALTKAGYVKKEIVTVKWVLNGEAP